VGGWGEIIPYSKKLGKLNNNKKWCLGGEGEKDAPKYGMWGRKMPLK
jgi:hypothetical protein